MEFKGFVLVNLRKRLYHITVTGLTCTPFVALSHEVRLPWKQQTPVESDQPSFLTPALTEASVSQ